MRSDEKFDLFWKDFKNKAAIFDVDPRIEECLGGSGAPEFDDDQCNQRLIRSGRFQNIHQIRKSPSQSRKRKRL